jgi:DNA-binding GntR family transcriptional regulator
VRALSYITKDMSPDDHVTITKPVFRTKADLVHQHLRDRILNGELRPGAELSITTVARDLGISEIPVREGFKRLEFEGLLALEAHKTARIPLLDAHDVEELFAIRTELESLALRHAAKHITPTQLDRTGEILDAMATAEAARDAVAYGRLNREFHLAIYSAQPYRRLFEMICQLWDSTDWCRRIFAADSDYVFASSAEHKGIHEALKAGDGERAALLLQQQKARGCEWLLEHAAYERGSE